MASIVLAGNTSGSITISSPSVSGSNTLTLPASTGTIALTAAPTFTGQATIPTINLTGGQITFPATQSPSADANCLDDYEEGTWTPSQGTQLTVVGTFSSSGNYTKIGRVVTINGVLRGTTSVSIVSVGDMFRSLPFSASIVSGVYYYGACTNDSASISNSTILGASVGYNVGPAISATPSISFSVTYFV